MPRTRHPRSSPLASKHQLALPAVAHHDAATRKQARLDAAEARRRRGGRPPKPVAERGMPHAPRPFLAKRFPVHVTIRLLAGLPSLRARKSFRVARRVLRAAAHRFGQMFRVVEFSVQTNHVHLVVEAENRRELSRGMQGLGIRLAKNLNTAFRRRGAVLEDRYHAHILETQTATLRALRYVRQNRDLHRWRRGQWASWFADPCSTAVTTLRTELPPNQNWLLTRARAALRRPDG